MEDQATQIAFVIPALGLMLTAAGLFYAGGQYRNSQRVAEADFLLRLDDMLFSQHEAVHSYLRPGGKWAGGTSVPASAQEWSMLEGYMGMFERVKMMLDCGLLGIDSVDRFYGYRIRNIVANPEIVKAKGLPTVDDWMRLTSRERSTHPWKDFIELWHTLEKHRGAA